MPDLTPFYSQQCMEWKSKIIEVRSDKDPNVVYHVQASFQERFAPWGYNHYFCDCSAYKFKKMGMSNNLCKHIQRVVEQFCEWHKEYSDEGQTDEQAEKQICPACGGRTEVVVVMG